MMYASSAATPNAVSYWKKATMDPMAAMPQSSPSSPPEGTSNSMSRSPNAAAARMKPHIR